MAVARAQAASSGLNAFAIVSVCVAVVSLGGLIFFYTQQSQLESDIAAAQNAANSARQQVSTTNRQVGELARLIVGNDQTTEPTEIREELQRGLDKVFADRRLQESGAGFDRESTIMTVLNGLYMAYASAAQAEQDLLTANKEHKDKIDSINKTANQIEADFKTKTQEMEERVKAVENQSAKARQEWEQQVADLTRQLADASANAAKELNDVRARNEALESQMAAAQARINDLTSQLASFKPSTEHTAVLQVADGHIVRTVPGEDVVYIGIGQQEGVNPGMTFAVYSRARGITSDGRGKASIEVIKVFGGTSECRVLWTTPGDPLVTGDIIANPVFDKSRKLRFVVAGDFDLNFDGVFEDVGGLGVANLIRRSGGKVEDKVDTQTDFVVMGSPPPVMSEDADTDPGVLAARAAELEAARQSFDEQMQEARTIGIPILNRTQFLHFIGKQTPSKGETDSPQL